MLFASEAKAFLNNFELTKNKNREFYNAFQHCLENTLWKEFILFKAASYLVLNIRNLKFKIQKYWTLQKEKLI